MGQVGQWERILLGTVVSNVALGVGRQVTELGESVGAKFPKQREQLWWTWRGGTSGELMDSKVSGGRGGDEVREEGRSRSVRAT